MTIERHGPFVDLTADQIAQALEPIGLARRPRTVSPLTGGRANTSYRIAVDGEPPVVLRLITRDPAGAALEHALLSTLSGRLPVASIVDADLVGHRLGHPYLLLSWLDGSMLEDCLIEPGGIAEALAEPLLALREIRYPTAGLLGPDLAIVTPFSVADAVLPYVEKRLQGIAGDRLGRPGADCLRRRLAGERARLNDLDGVCCLVHGDLNLTNLLLRRESRRWTVSGLLDWEFAYANTPLADLCQLVRYQAQLPPGTLDRLAAALGGLPPDWQRIVAVIDLINLCTFLERPAEHATILADARRRVLATLAMLES